MQSQVSTTRDACSADGRPYVPESRSLKKGGLVLVALAAPGTAWLANHPMAGQWLNAGWFDWALAAGALLLTTNLALAGALVLAAGFGLGRSWDDPRGRRGMVLTAASVNVAIPVLGFSLLQDDPLIDAFVLVVLVLRLFRNLGKPESRGRRWLRYVVTDPNNSI